ncbi:hypothetical protein WJX74_006231 [Apatococcus lobatus]|uniref:F-box domain-containing protein n=1 Tax=Apatococcus lobatus TaxID=904363 RepID=A0AAW1R117_9CHLO
MKEMNAFLVVLEVGRPREEERARKVCYKFDDAVHRWLVPHKLKRFYFDRMDGLPEDVLQGIVDLLDPASVQSLALSSKSGREVARLGRGTVSVHYGDCIRAVAESPHTVRAVVYDTDIQDEEGWPLEQWPSSASRLEWVGHTCSNMQRVVVDDPRVREQEVVAHSFVLPKALPESLRTIRSYWLHNEGVECLGQLPHVRALTTMVYNRMQQLDICLGRLQGLRSIDLECWSLAGQPVHMGIALLHLWHLSEIRHIRLSRFSPGHLPHIPSPGLLDENPFPRLEKLELLPDIAGGRPARPITSLHGFLRALPALTSLVVGGPCDWTGCGDLELEDLCLEMQGLGLVVCNSTIYPRTTGTFTMVPGGPAGPVHHDPRDRQKPGGPERGVAAGPDDAVLGGTGREVHRGRGRVVGEHLMWHCCKHMEGTGFATIFKAFIGEALLAFPAYATVLAEAAGRYEQDPARAEAEFAEDSARELTPLLLSQSPDLLGKVGNTRLFRGFAVPTDAHESNKAETLKYIREMMSMSMVQTMVPQEKLDAVFDKIRDNPLNLAADAGELDIKQLFSSQEGLQLTSDVASALGLDVDMSSAEARQAMALMQMLF